MIHKRFWRVVTVGLWLTLAALACTNPLSGNPPGDQPEEVKEIEESEEVIAEAEESDETEEPVETEAAEEAIETEEATETEEPIETEEPVVETATSQGKVATPQDTPTPTAAPDRTPTPETEPEIDLPQTYRNQEAGYSLSLPETWVTMEIYTATYAAPSQGELDQLINEGIVTGPSISAAIGPPEMMQLDSEIDTAEELIRQTIDVLKEEPTLTVGKPTNLTIGGLEASSFDVTGPDEITGQILTTRLIAVVGPEHAGMFVGVSPEADWEDFSPILDAVIESVEFFQPGQ